MRYMYVGLDTIHQCNFIQTTDRYTYIKYRHKVPHDHLSASSIIVTLPTMIDDALR